MEPILTKQGTEISKITPARCNIFVVSRLGKVVLIDTGMPSDRNRIKQALMRKGITPGVVVLTHTHFDHAGNAAWLRREYGAKIIVQASEAETLRKGDMPIPAGTLGFTSGLVSIGRHLPSWFTYEPCQPDIVVDEILDLSSFGINGFVLHTPGHCPGEVAIVIDDEIALCGDSLLGVFPGKIFPPFADDVGELMKSWKKLLDTKCRLFLPGHGRPIGREILAAEYEKRSGTRSFK